jgi:hypothetical protein
VLYSLNDYEGRFIFSNRRLLNCNRASWLTASCSVNNRPIACLGVSVHANIGPIVRAGTCPTSERREFLSLTRRFNMLQNYRRRTARTAVDRDVFELAKVDSQEGLRIGPVAAKYGMRETT